MPDGHQLIINLYGLLRFYENRFAGMRFVMNYPSQLTAVFGMQRQDTPSISQALLTLLQPSLLMCKAQDLVEFSVELPLASLYVFAQAVQLRRNTRLNNAV